MSLPKRGSRKLVIGDETYRWMLSIRRCDETLDSGYKYVLLIINRESDNKTFFHRATGNVNQMTDSDLLEMACIHPKDVRVVIDTEKRNSDLNWK